MDLETLLRRVFVSPYTWLRPLETSPEVTWVSASLETLEPGDVFLATTAAAPEHLEAAKRRGAWVLLLIGKEPPGYFPASIPVVWVQTPHPLSTVYRHLLQALTQPAGPGQPQVLFWRLLSGESGHLGHLRVTLENLGLKVTRSYRVFRLQTVRDRQALALLKGVLPSPPQALVAPLRPGELAALVAEPEEAGSAWKERLAALRARIGTFRWALTHPVPWTEWPQAFHRAGTMLEIARCFTLIDGLHEDEARPYLHMLQVTRPEEARLLVQRVLGRVLAHPERDTLLLSLEAILVKPSLSQAARALYIHRNTLHQRLERLAHLTGYRFDNPHHRLALHLAWFWEKWLHHR